MMWPMPMLVLFAALLLAAAGCGDEEPPAGDPAAAETLGAEVRYTRSGGIAGTHDVLVVRPDGTGELTDRRGQARPIEVPAEQMQDLARAVAAAELDEVPADSTGAQPAPDAFVHTLEHAGRKIRTDDPNVPPPMKPLIGRLARIIEDNR